MASVHPYFKCPVVNYSDLRSFYEGKVNITTIALGDNKNLNLYHRQKGYKHLTIFFSHRVARNPEKKPPFFAGLNVANDIPTDVLCVDDVAMQYADNICIGWHAGTHNIRTQDILPKVIEQFIRNGSYDNITFTGGSGGGFAALFYASAFPGSKVFVVNPQTDIFRYHQQHVRPYIEGCFPGSDTKAILNTKQIPGIVTSLPAYLRDKNIRVAYFQNIDDTHHVEEHMFPLMFALGAETKIKNQLCGGFRFLFSTWGEGHTGLTREEYARCLDTMIRTDSTYIDA